MESVCVCEVGGGGGGERRRYRELELFISYQSLFN